MQLWLRPRVANLVWHCLFMKLAAACQPPVHVREMERDLSSVLLSCILLLIQLSAAGPWRTLSFGWNEVTDLSCTPKMSADVSLKLFGHDKH